jgi:hypothetical protein
LKDSAKMIMNPMTDIIVSAVAEENTAGAVANSAASVSHGKRNRSDRVTILAFP